MSEAEVPWSEDDVTDSMARARETMERILSEAPELADVRWVWSGPALVMMSGDPDHMRMTQWFRRAVEPLFPRLLAGNDVKFRQPFGPSRDPDLFLMDDAESAGTVHGEFASMAGVKLVLEVTSRSTRGVDFGDKVKQYAASGVPVYVVVDRRDHKIHVFSDPDRGRHDYDNESTHRIGKPIKLPEPLGTSLDTQELLKYLP